MDLNTEMRLRDILSKLDPNERDEMNELLDTYETHPSQDVAWAITNWMMRHPAAMSEKRLQQFVRNNRDTIHAAMSTQH